MLDAVGDLGAVACFLAAPVLAAVRGWTRWVTLLLVVGFVVALLPGASYEDGTERWFVIAVPFFAGVSAVLAGLFALPHRRR